MISVAKLACGASVPCMHHSLVYALLIDTPAAVDCHVLRAPGGHLLCVIPVHGDPGVFTAQAITWP